MTKEELIAFEEEIKELFLDRKIRSPIHLSGGNEEQLIEIFKEIKTVDWVFSTHRSHYHALLKGIDPEWLKKEILEGRSMHIMNKEHRFFSSSIIGTTCPVGVGIAMAIKMKEGKERVWIFCGDMASYMGIFHESLKYAKNHNLPACFVIEDNSYSTNTPTAEVWGIKEKPKVEGKIYELDNWGVGKLLYYRYSRYWPHVGCGRFVKF